jgi:hypothetical protein
MKRRPLAACIVFFYVTIVLVAFHIVECDAALLNLEDNQYLYDTETPNLLWYQDIAGFNADVPDPSDWFNSSYATTGTGLPDVFDVNTDGVMDMLNWRIAVSDEVAGLVEHRIAYDNFWTVLHFTFADMVRSNWFAPDPAVVDREIDGVLWLSDDMRPYSWRLSSMYPHWWNYMGAIFSYPVTTAMFAVVRDDYGYPAWISAYPNWYYFPVADVTFGEPVPEPATILLFSTGCVALAGIRARRKKKRQI